MVRAAIILSPLFPVNPGKVYSAKIIVELVGLEPTTSSLRILNPVRDAATQKKCE
jgi:hypothetical protein